MACGGPGGEGERKGSHSFCVRGVSFLDQTEDLGLMNLNAASWPSS